MERVYRYTAEAKEWLGAKTKPEPWLHFIFQRTSSTIRYAIFVWDTRQVVGTAYMPYNHRKQPTLTIAVDNGKPLVGKTCITIDGKASSTRFEQSQMANTMNTPNTMKTPVKWMAYFEVLDKDGSQIDDFKEWCTANSEAEARSQFENDHYRQIQSGKLRISSIVRI